MKSIVKKYCFIIPLALAVFTAPAFGAQAPLLPANNTGNLYVMVDGSDGNVNILEVAPDGTPVILVSNADLYNLVGLNPSTDELDLDQGGIVTTEAGSIIFTLFDDSSTSAGTWIVERLPNETLSIIADQDDIVTETEEEYAEPKGLVIGDDDMLYFIDDVSGSLIQIDPGTGAVSQFVTKAEFQTLIYTSNFDPESGLSADKDYIYIISDGTPDAIYRVDYSGNPEVFASGPGTDPSSFSPGLVAIATYPQAVGGSFTLEVSSDNFANWIQTGLLAFNGSYPDALAVETIINNAYGGYPLSSVTGGGTVNDPWIVELVDGAFWDLRPGFIDLDVQPDNSATHFFIDNEWRSPTHENVADHVEAIGTASATGEIVIDLIDYDRDTPGDLGLATWSVGDSASEVKAALELAVGLLPGDVEVTGAGTLANPWVITFVGNLSKHHIRIDIDSFSGGEVDKPLLIGTMVNARAFDDADAYLTRNESGSLMLNDDKHANFLYEISASGDTSIFLNEWDLVLATGGEMDLEGGVAYDGNGNLYVGNNYADEYYDSPGAILKIAPDKTIQSWLTAETVAALTGEDEERIKFEGMAFERLTESQGVCATLGDNASRWAMDTDIFTFEGETGDEVTITLSADESGSYTGKRATLILVDIIHGAFLFKKDRGKISNSVSATLPANGKYKVLVHEQSKYARGEKFKGDYCLELDSSNGTILNPTRWVE